MIRVHDKINQNKPINIGNVVDISIEKGNVELPMKAIVIFDNTDLRYKLLDLYTFRVIKNSESANLNGLIERFGLVLYSSDVAITMQ